MCEDCICGRRNLYGHSVQVSGPSKTCTDTVRSVRSGGDAHAWSWLYSQRSNGAASSRDYSAVSDALILAIVSRRVGEEEDNQLNGSR